MSNHPNRGKLGRHALELIAHFSAGGLALTRDQQAALGTICRAGAAYKRLQEERCNGPGTMPTYGISAPDMASALRAGDWKMWEKHLANREAAIKARIKAAWADLPTEFYGVVYQGDPRGITVKLQMATRLHHLHDAFDREGVCVPGS